MALSIGPVARRLRALEKRLDAQVTKEVLELLRALKAAGVTGEELARVSAQVREKEMSENVAKVVS